MKIRLSLTCLSCLVFAATLAAQDVAAEAEPAKPAKTLALQSIGPIAFAKGHTLLVSDPRGAAVYAFDLDDQKGKGLSGDTSIAEIDGKIAALVGTEKNQVRIVDLAVDPNTQQAYIAATRGRGRNAQPILVRVDAKGALTLVGLKDRKFTVAKFGNAPPAAQAQRGARQGRGRGRRNRNQRTESITDLAFVKDKVVVAGLSNEEFASKLRVLGYPFDAPDAGTSVEIYHGAHGKYETRSPVRTFVPYEIDGRSHIVAAYTCTPLVIFPMGELTPGKKVRGKTIAELGNRNRPLDMIVYTKDGKDFLLMANSARGVMKVPTAGMLDEAGITDRVSGTAGTKYETIQGWSGVMQLAKLDATHALILQQSADRVFTLKAVPLP